MNPAQLVMDVEGFDTYAELLKFLDNGNFTDKAFSEEKIELSDAKPVYLPDGFKLINQGTSQVARSIRSYMSSRGFTIEELSKHGIGYVATEGPFFGYLIIPYYYKGTLRYYNARNVIGQGPRYNNPNKDITGLGKEFIIFNQDALDMYSSIFICEGAINALTMGDRAIATMGKAVSRYQLNGLIKSPCQRYIILLDFDAQKYAINLALKLILYKKVKVVFFEDSRDVNDLGKKAVLRKVYRTRYTTYQELIKLKNLL
nr:MAG: DNA primase catalytic core, N-terminal domain [Bacteriophage sp.]